MHMLVDRSEGEGGSGSMAADSTVYTGPYILQSEKHSEVLRCQGRYTESVYCGFLIQQLT